MCTDNEPKITLTAGGITFQDADPAPGARREDPRRAACDTDSYAQRMTRRQSIAQRVLQSAPLAQRPSDDGHSVELEPIVGTRRIEPVRFALGELAKPCLIVGSSSPGVGSISWCLRLRSETAKSRRKSLSPSGQDGRNATSAAKNSASFSSWRHIEKEPPRGRQQRPSAAFGHRRSPHRGRSSPGLERAPDLLRAGALVRRVEDVEWRSLERRHAPLPACGRIEDACSEAGQSTTCSLNAGRSRTIATASQCSVLRGTEVACA
jgi:hypothetical protein